MVLEQNEYEIGSVMRNSEYDQEIQQSKTAEHGATRKSHTTITRHQEDKPSKATSSIFPIRFSQQIPYKLGHCLRLILAG